MDDSADYIYAEFEDDGYAVFSAYSMEMMEYSLQGKLPYSNFKAQNYYAGPSNYLHKANNNFINIATNEELKITDAVAKEFSQQTRKNLINEKFCGNIIDLNEENIIDKICNVLPKSNNLNGNATINSTPKYDNGNLIFPEEGTGTLIPNYRYFLAKPTHGNNNSGTCGPVAAQLLLGYHNYFNHRGIIPDRFLNGYDDISNAVTEPNKNPNYCTDPTSMTNYTTGTRSEPTGTNSFYNEIVNTIMNPNIGSSINIQVKNGINTYLGKHLNSNEYNLNYENKLLSSINTSKITSEINSGRPIIISMLEILGGINHFVVGYGYQNYTYPSGEGTYFGYISHTGWNNKYCVWFNSAWCNGYVSLKINHTHNYSTVGAIGNTGRTEYKCSSCGHRTDSAINMSADDRYVERAVILPQNGFTYKDYYLTFNTAGNKLFQTFGVEDTKLYLLDTEYNQLAFNDDSGYNLNSLFSYNVAANTGYILRVQLYDTDNSGSVKIGITPSDTVYSQYEDIWHVKSTYHNFYWNSEQNTTKVICFTPETSGTYIFQTGSGSEIDTYLYFIDPESTDFCLEDDDGAGDRDAVIEKNLYSGTRYFVIVAAYNIRWSSGSMELNVHKL